GQNIPTPGIPESFKVLTKELQSLGLDINVLDKNGEVIVLDENYDDDGYENIVRENDTVASDKEFAAAGFGFEDEEGNAEEFSDKEFEEVYEMDSDIDDEPFNVM
ncbi:MAG: hypothetical protein IJO47_03640, partial [Clostridia bacterium]|nr:hypothetical protein [Clostridia bacterium]